MKNKYICLFIEFNIYLYYNTVKLKVLTIFILIYCNI